MTGRARAGGCMCGWGKAKLWKIISVLALVSILYCGGRNEDGTTSADSGITGSGTVIPTGETSDFGGSTSAGLVYSFVGWSPNSTAETYPTDMKFPCSATTDPDLSATIAGNYTGNTNPSADTFVSVKGENLGGISLLNTGTAVSTCSTDGGTTNGYLAGIDIGPFNITGKTGLRIFFEAAQTADQPREFGLRLQYSTDNGASFTDYPGPVEFNTSTVGTSTSYYQFGPNAITQIDNQAQVILRFRYYYISGAGNRTRIAIRNIRISDDATTPTFSGITSVEQVNSTTLRLNWSAATDDVTSANYMRYDIYQATTSGAQVYTQPSYSVRGVTTTQITSLSSSTQYFFVVRARDEQGNRDTNTVQQSGTTAADTVPPVISSYSPANSALWPVATSTISVTFDKAMLLSSFTGTSMKVVSGTDCSAAGMANFGIALSNGNRTATITLTDARTDTQQYTTCINGVQSIAGVSIASSSSATWTATTATILSDLIISEYIEGNSNNKAIEIYNGTGATVNLDNYRLAQYNNGSATLFGTTLSFTAGTSLTHGNTWVVCNSGIDALFSSNCNQTSTDVVNFNGDDAVVLQKNTGSFVDLDVIGDHTGTDPGAGWTVPAGSICASCTAGSSTVDTILKRANTVTGPTATPATSFGQWNTYNASSNQNIDVYHGLGQYDSTPPTKAFNVSSATASGGTTVTVTFNFEPTIASANTPGNYSIREGSSCGSGTVLAVSGAVRTAKTVALTTATQTNGQAYIVCASNLLRFPDNATLSATNSATFTGSTDTTAPTVNTGATTPTGSSVALSTTTASVTFSENMNSTNAIAAYTIKQTNCSGTTIASTPTGTTNAYSLTVTNLLSPGVTYAHCVATTATDMAGNALASLYESTFTMAALSEPNSLTYTPASTQVTIGWTNSANATGGVKIVRATGSAPADCNSGTVLCTGATCNATLTSGSAGRTYIDTGLTNDVEVFYRVCAVHATPAALSAGVTGSATPSNTDTTPPSNPGSPTYTAGNNQVTLGWSNPGDADFAGIKIVRADGTSTAPADCNSGTTVCTGTGCNGNVTPGQTGLTFVNNTLSNGTQYAYRMCAYDTASNMSSGVTGTTTPSATGIIVISQVYGAGGNSGATLRNDFIELFNRGSGPQSLNGWSIQYASATGNFTGVHNLANVSIPAGGYYLVQLASGGANGATFTADEGPGSINMAAGSGKVLLANTTTALGAVSSLPHANIVDFVAFGTGTSLQEGGAATGVISTINSAYRKLNGCQDTDNNGSDFTVAAVANPPRTSATTLAPCS